MANKKLRLGRLVTVLAFVWVLVGCATSVPIKSVRSPTIDTSGVERMAFRSFENVSGVGGSVGAQLIQELNQKAEQAINNSGKFTRVSPTDPSADGIFTGKITNITTNDTNRQIQRKDRQGNVTIVTQYNREVTLAFDYSVINTRTNMPINTVSKSGTASSSSEGDPSRLYDTLTLAKRIVNNQMGDVTKDIVPTIVSTNRNLMNETSKDKAVKAKMKEAQTLVKNGNYQLAIQQYDAIANESGSVAARTNAGILRQSVESDSSSRAELIRLFSEKGGPVEKAINAALDALYANIPNGENITIIKQQATDRDRLDYAVDQITKSITSSGGKLTISDRSNQALITAEQQYQLSGNVSDETMVSIGKEIGVHYIVLCGISGQMSMRRLNVRVLSVETAQIVSQNDFEI